LLEKRFELHVDSLHLDGVAGTLLRSVRRCTDSVADSSFIDLEVMDLSMSHAQFFDPWNKHGTPVLLHALCTAAVWSALALPGVAQAGARDEALPARNLLVEWRTNSERSVQDSRSGLRNGQVSIDTRGVWATGTVQSGTVQTESRQQGSQQVQVLNGGRARLYVGTSQPYTVWQWSGPLSANSGSGTFGMPGSASGQGGQAVPQTVWIDLGQGLSVRPRWGGGRGPVVVELEAQTRESASPSGRMLGQLDPDGQSRRSEVASTLSVPLGQWTVVARSGGRSEAQRSGTLSTRELDDSQSDLLEIRITAP
jgi:hypothetical protein